MITLYHCTPAYNAKAIERDGLLPCWNWIVQWPAGAPPIWQHQPVHLSEEPMPGFVADLHDTEEVAVFSANIDADLAQELRLGEDGLGTWAIYAWVPPTALTRLPDVTVEGGDAR